MGGSSSQRTSGGSARESRTHSGGRNKQRRYNCHRFQHIGKDCPVKRTHVNHIGGKQEVGEEQERISKVITSRED